MKTVRTVEWGYWGINFWNGDCRVYPLTATKAGQVIFACGFQGPVDGAIGSPLRKEYQKMCQDWVEKAILP